MKYIVAACILLLVSCVENNKDFIGSAKTYHLVVSDTLGVECDDLGNPCFILPYKDFVLLADNSGRHLLTLYHCGGQGITNLLEKGKAENEALIITSIHKVGKDTLYVYDDFSKKKIYFSIDSNQCQLARISNVDNFYSSIETENFVICSSDSINNRFSVKDKRNDVYYSFGDYSLYKNAQTSGVGLSDGLLAVCEQQNRFAWFSRAGASLCISSFDGAKGEIIYQKIYQEPEFEVINNEDENISLFSTKTTIGFTSITTSQDYIFALFNGLPYSEVVKNPERDNLLCNNLCVFDWNGNLLGNIKLNINVKDIYYDEEIGKMNLIGINSRGECQIFTINNNAVYNAIKTFTVH